MAEAQYVTLSAGNRMPLVGLGTGYFASPEEAAKAVDEALDAGYHLIDTASLYGTEKAIGDILQQRFQSDKSKREDIFIITKADPKMMSTPEEVRKNFNLSLEALQLDYIDLYLFHWPFGFNMQAPQGYDYDHIAAWKVLEQLVDEGKVNAIGLSNFNSVQIDKIRAVARIPISNLQVECHLYLQQNDLLKFCKERNISFTSYSSFGSPGTTTPDYFRIRSTLQGPLNEPLVAGLAKKYNKTSAQILLRHLVQQGIAVIPKSGTPSRIKSNYDIFSFNLSQEDMKSLSDFPSSHRIFSVKNMPGAVDTSGYPFTIPF